ncbi:MAG: hypothetical protein WC196_01935 [Bacilli bacterium]|nr:hypothetical protein [Bacilli bacterium]MDD3422813.1 hypothetical protein [Bacilli bacterium]MDD4065638.1 hypothetical protein [Bacilli bacterium]
MSNQKKSLKQEMRREFAVILPNVLSAVVNTPVTPETTNSSDEIIFKKVNFRMAFAALTLLFFFAVAGGSSYSYANPSTYLTISFANTGSSGVSTLAATSSSDNTYLLTLGVNNFDFVVDYGCSNSSFGAELTENVHFNNQPVKDVISNLINYGLEKGYLNGNDLSTQMQVNVITNYETSREKYCNYVQEVSDQKGFARSVSIANPQVFSNDIYNQIVTAYPAMSPGRVCAIQEILVYSNAYTLDELASLSNSELAKILVAIHSAK